MRRAAILVALALAGCEGPSAEFAAGGADAAPAAKAAKPGEIARKVVVTASLDLSVTDLEAVRPEVERLTLAAGGYVGKSESHSNPRSYRSVSWVLRVPAARYAETLAQLEKLGTVTRTSTEADDVTLDSIDVSARVANLKKQEDALNRMLAETKADKFVELSKAIREVRTELDSAAGRQKYLDQAVALATLKVSARESTPYTPPDAPVAPGFAERARRTLAASAHGLAEFGVSLALFAVALVPWLPLILVAGLIFRWGIRRLTAGRRPANRLAVQPRATQARPVPPADHRGEAVNRIPLLSALALFLAGCSGQAPQAVGDARESAETRRAAAAAVAPQVPPVNAPAAAPVSPDITRMVVHTANIELSVKSLAETQTSVERITDEVKGYIAKSDIAGSSGDRRAGTWTLKVPVGQYRETLGKLAALGSLVKQSADSQDVTEEFYDLGARVKSLKAEEEVLQKLLKEAVARLDEIIKIREQIKLVRLDIDRAEGRMKYLATRADLSTIVVTAREEGVYAAPPVTPPPAATPLRRGGRRHLQAVVGAVGRGRQGGDPGCGRRRPVAAVRGGAGAVRALGAAALGPVAGAACCGRPRASCGSTRRRSRRRGERWALTDS